MQKSSGEKMDFRVGKGTPMGDALRRFWLPACTGAELPEPDGDPLRVWLLGQTFVAFRDSSGAVGLLDEACPHRNVSLVYGRNEGGGLRCLWHQWKFAVDGSILEMPNVNHGGKIGRVCANAYPVVESGGLVWTYLGPKELRPPFPVYSWSSLPPENVTIIPVDADCNFVRPLEGLVDSSHVSLLHVDAVGGMLERPEGLQSDVAALDNDSMPRFDLEFTDFGFHYGATRAIAGDDGARQVRVTAYAAPCLAFIAPGLAAHFSIPQDDEHCRFYTILWSYDERLDTGAARDALLEWYGLTDEQLDLHGMRCLPPGPEPLGRRNHYVQDRKSMREGESYSGRLGLTAEDLIMSCSIPGIDDHGAEHLVTADVGVVSVRRLLWGMAQAVADGRTPVGLTPTTPFGDIRAISGVLQKGDDWRDLVPAHIPLRKKAA